MSDRMDKASTVAVIAAILASADSVSIAAVANPDYLEAAIRLLREAEIRVARSK